MVIDSFRMLYNFICDFVYFLYFWITWESCL